MPSTERHDPTPDQAPGARRHRLRITCPTGQPAEAVLELDGHQLTYVTRVELVLDAATRQAEARLTVPAALLDLDVDAAAFVTAHTEAVAEPDRPPSVAAQAWAEVQARHRTQPPTSVR